MTGSARKVSSTILEQLQKVFTENLGPIGMIEFEELKKKGELREKDALELVNEMVEEGSLEEEKGDKLKMALNKIYGTVAGFEEEKSNDDSMVTNSKAKKPVEESPSFWSKLQFWRKEEEK